MSIHAAVRRHFTTPALRRRWFVLLFTLALTSQPLFGALGYEGALVLTPLISLFALAVGVDAVRDARQADATDPHAMSLQTPGERLRLLFLRGLGDLCSLLTLSLGAFILANFWQVNCDLPGGLLWFLVLPTASGLLGLVAGLWGGVLARRRPVQLLLAGLPLLFSLVLGVWRIYVDPVVYAIDPFWGYFAGPLYDEAIPITGRLLWFRAYNFLLAGAAVALLSLTLGPGLKVQLRGVSLRRSPFTVATLFACLLPGTLLGVFAAENGFHATEASLANALPRTRVTDHFVIHYAANSAAARDIELLAAEHEFAWRRLAAQIGREPRAPVHSFVFPSPELKRAWIGAGNTEVAPPWRGHIYLNEQAFPHRVLHHELAHVFSYVVGEPLFGTSSAVSWRGLRVNLALVEGFATAFAPRSESGLDLHDQAAILDRLELRPVLGDIMGFGFWGKSSRRAYTAAGSFSRWLIDTRGVDPFLQLYGTAGDFELAYGTSLDALEVEWLAYLRARPLRARDIEALRQRFKQRPIFQRPCAHRAADLLAGANLAHHRGLEVERIDLLRDLCTIEPEQPEHRLLLAQAQVQAGMQDAASATLAELSRQVDLTDTIAALVDERLGDLALARFDLPVALTYYDRALTRGLGDNQVRQLQIKRMGAADPALAPRVLAYFDPFEPNPEHPSEAVLRLYAAEQIAALPRYAPLGGYLLGRQLLNVQQGAAAIEPLQRALHPEDEEHPLATAELRRGALLMLLEAQARARNYDAAARVLAELQDDPDADSGLRLDATLWTERLEFLRAYLP
ncbi:hypothetical protein [Nannocystis bainbridge]|uniref:Tetratricopeptide repeat protein n=1 Tax=Nannocystis bainbridge TaxID=2995303 RepID=A0ABT5E3V2_9BACT|nr:hypothetical protein [Nannocystis bainbridge]MDC0720118.1 hypothetical protein [Nannocystis bainbridge]